MVTMRQKSVAETPETVKDAMTSGKRRIEPPPWDTRKIPKGTYHVIDTGKRHPEGIRQNTVKRAMTRTKRQAGAHPRTSVSSRKGKIRTRESGKLHPEDKSGELVTTSKTVNKENIR